MGLEGTAKAITSDVGAGSDTIASMLSGVTLLWSSMTAPTIMADQAITLNTGAALEGRALARIAAVALDSNAVTRPYVSASPRGAP